MDEGLITPKPSEVETGVSAANSVAADAVRKGDSGSKPASAMPATAALPALNLNELQNLPSEELESLACDFDLRLHPTRSIHQHIVDIIRAGLNRGSRVTAEGFLDQVGDAFALLRYPQLNFLPVPEDVCVSRAIIEQFHLRPGQWLAGTLRLPRDRERSLALDEVMTIEGEPAERWTEP
ncbi:MAG: hypothetical protein WA183_19440, partial [Chthoniobacterales bacterium]